MKDKTYIYVGKCVQVGMPRVWGRTQEDCQKAIDDYCSKKLSIRTEYSGLKMFRYEGNDPAVALSDPKGGEYVES
tara:strand:+ start:360 stop:584 length:225 start_codon:yes stop_codon:yes gene_type:complete